MNRKSKGVAFALWLFLGFFGAHKFYVNKTGLGILYFFTGGLFGIGWMIDIFTIWGDVDYCNLMLSGRFGMSAQTAVNTNTNRIVVNVDTKQKKEENSECFIEKLKKLSELKEIGVLTEDEFNTQKTKLLT